MAITDWEALRSDWSRLRSFYAEVRGAVANSRVPEEAYSGINNLLTIAARNIARLGETGDYGQGVISGKVSPAEWAELANVTADGLKSVLSIINEEDLVARAWAEVVVPTAIEARDTAKALVSGGTNILTLVVIGLALIVVIKVIR